MKTNIFFDRITLSSS